MAITRAQQVRQMLEDGGMLVSPSTTGKRPGYRSARAQEVQGRTPSTKASNPNQRSGASEERSAKEYIGGKAYDVTPATRNEREAQRELLQDQIQENLKDFRQLDSRGRKVTSFVSRFSPVAKILSRFGPLNTRDFYTDKYLSSKNAPMTKQDFSKLSPQEQEELFDSYMTDRMSGDTDAYGNTLSQGEGDGGMSDYERRLLELEQATRAQAAVTPVETPFAPNLRLLAGGGMTEDAPVEGGIMDLESGRQMYFLGKLVKKATRAVKKIVKSPIGKAALLYFGGQALMPGGGKGLSSFFGKGSFNPLKAISTVSGLAGPRQQTGLSGLGKLLNKFGLADFQGGLTGKGMFGIGGGLLALLPFLSEEEQTPLYQGADIADPRFIMANYPQFTNPRLMADGGEVEPVAKKTMPLLDMDGKEMDFRAEGGFVPIGRMEKADDVPARLSKNEFVFTADAVRNAGDGNVDKGAEVMYNMMKNLESGGDVSEESQGLEGARKMFQTSQRLEEVL